MPLRRTLRPSESILALPAYIYMPQNTKRNTEAVSSLKIDIINIPYNVVCFSSYWIMWIQDASQTHAKALRIHSSSSGIYLFASTAERQHGGHRSRFEHICRSLFPASADYPGNSYSTQPDAHCLPAHTHGSVIIS